MFVLRLGPYIGFLLNDRTEDERGVLPDYTAKPVEGGVVISGVLCPFTVRDYFSAGLYFDMQRGFSVFWEDTHHEGEGFGTGKTSAMSIGLLLKY